MLIVIIVLFVLLLVSLAGGYYLFASVFDRNFKSKHNNDPNFLDSEKDFMRPTSRRFYECLKVNTEKFNKLPLKEISIQSFDGLKLVGYLLEGNPKEVVICVHGYRSTMQADYSDRSKIYIDRGSTVLFMNDRAHGKSEGRYLGFSELDRLDVAKWIDKINEMYGDPKIYLHGVSMGGATVIHCANMKLKNLCGIVDDCGFDSILGISKALITDMYHIPYFPFGYCAWFWSLVLNKTSFNRSMGEKCAAESLYPIVFIHGKDDAFVPCRMSEAMYAACTSPKELHLIDNCGHAAAYMIATEEYTAAVNRLLDGELCKT